MAEKPTHVGVRGGPHGRVTGYKPTGKVKTKKLWEIAEQDYRRAHKLPFTAQRKTYWESSPSEGVPSFRDYFKKWKAKRDAKKKGQKKAVGTGGAGTASTGTEDQ